MLLEISIRNIALIESLRLSFESGLNVLTGETGAGKSIVVDSLSLALGGRADRDMIRSGADRALVSALFDVSDSPEVLEALERMGLEAEEGLLSMSREISASGRSICRVGGTAAPLSRFREISRLLVDMHGQHEFQQLTDPSRHLGFLDAYGDETHHALMAAVSRAHSRWKETRDALEVARTEQREQASLRETLAAQVEEIDALRLKPGEEEVLIRKSGLLRNAEKIAAAANRAYRLVYQGGKSLSAQAALEKAAQSMEAIAGLDERFGRLAARLQELFYGAQDAGLELQDIVESLDYDEGAAERIGRRLNAISQIEDRYGPTVEDVLAFRAQARARLTSLEAGNERVATLEKEESGLRTELEALCGQLTQARQAIARNFCDRLLGELSDLGMEKTRFEVRFESLPVCAAHGRDRVEFLISPNPGEPLKPLAAIASGGELSRIMLAMKAIQADEGGVSVMVFDEIDTGISGRMAQVVGEKMMEIARLRQVLCVTHLSQIACMADHQYLVEKTVSQGRTGSLVRRLSPAERVQEIARLVGGAGDPQSSLRHAENMLRAAEALKSASASGREKP